VTAGGPGALLRFDGRDDRPLPRHGLPGALFVAPSSSLVRPIGVLVLEQSAAPAARVAHASPPPASRVRTRYGRRARSMPASLRTSAVIAAPSSGPSTNSASILALIARAITEPRARDRRIR
jgi:hypothetical protein